jgi:hypothetical protein
MLKALGDIKLNALGDIRDNVVSIGFGSSTAELGVQVNKLLF